LINKRWVKNQQLCSAFVKGYYNVITFGRYPIAIFDIQIHSSLLDINIHPRKEEVRFMHPRIVEQLIQQTVHTALENRLSQQLQKNVQIAPHIPSAHHATGATAQTDMSVLPSAREIFLKNIASSEPSNITAASVAFPDAFHDFEHANESLHKHFITPTTMPASEDTTQTIHMISKTDLVQQKAVMPAITIIGQYNKTYIVIEQNDGLLLIDQHAAHERILYELFAHRFDQVATITLLFPLIITLNAHGIHALEPYLSLFISNGIGVELFDAETIIIRSTHVYLKDMAIDELFHHMIVKINESHDLDKERCTHYINETLHA